MKTKSWENYNENQWTGKDLRR